LEGQLEVVGLELMAESIMAGTHSKSRRERVPRSPKCTKIVGGWGFAPDPHWENLQRFPRPSSWVYGAFV